MKAPDMSWVMPCITVADVEKSLDFYSKAFSFETVKKSNFGDDPEIVHGEMRYQDMIMMLGKQGACGQTCVTPKANNQASPMSLFAYVEDVDSFYKHAIENGAEEVQAPEDMFWGDRCCMLKDLDGYTWCIGTHLAEKA